MLILKNATIMTMNAQSPEADAMAIEPHCGKIAAVGSADFILAEFDSSAEVLDMHGATILPGLTDSHIHLRLYALNLQKLDLFGKHREEIVALVAERAQQSAPGEWVLGHGWAQSEWTDGHFPSAAELDAVAPQHPVYLSATSLHAGWCNTAALKAAGITAETPDPPNGQFQRGEDGAPTGMLFESAMQVITDAIPRTTAAQNTAAVAAAQRELWELGITGVHDFDRQASFIALQELHARGELKLRVHKNLPVEALDEILETGLRGGFGDDMLWVGGIKLFADGALGPRTAAMLQPYENESENTGMLFVDREEIFEHGRRAARGGLPMTVHAIGDRANHEVLAAYRQLRSFETERGLPVLRHRLEHAQIVHPDDFKLFGQLGVIASVQPIHQTSDLLMADAYWGERAVNSYAWKTLLQNGARLAFGSDAPVDSPNPFWGMYAALTRRRADGTPGEAGWYPEQKLDLHTALAGYTTGPAYATGKENQFGQIRRGFYADLIVLPKDPRSISVPELRAMRPTRVMVGGEWVV